MIARFLMAAAGLSLLLWTVAVRGNDAKEAAKKLEGTWAVESATLDGEPSEEKGGEVTFAGNKYTLKALKGKEKTLLFRLDPSQKPRTIDFAFVGEAPKNAAPGKGIYELDGDTLKICIDPLDKRPTEFTDKGQLLIALKRYNMYYTVDWSKWDKPDDKWRRIIVVIHNSPKGDYEHVIKVQMDRVTAVSQQYDEDGNKIVVAFDVPAKLTRIPKRLKVLSVEWNGAAVPSETLAAKAKKAAKAQTDK